MLSCKILVNVILHSERYIRGNKGKEKEENDGKRKEETLKSRKN
jgi:hypothetical protein